MASPDKNPFHSFKKDGWILIAASAAAAIGAILETIDFLINPTPDNLGQATGLWSLSLIAWAIETRTRPSN
ncbi:hypothetical protein A3D85_00895 [Candidatus Amesbacteria bacterium RIFCSPHIGHO2_02_FULL_47_9]|uniref:Holin n=1 Tax=Candidatus Amesbacteria bacterium RIFCSPHIGHO2_01_FULL_48_32b TaxID=1797253 RepID=A0A1F4YEH7_9BACT|nr:MAG: hypothetical protein A2876_03615 [Candidatus Amesbacteria bacterium RIFCSPHIGHO2_01_FULL_48_32b]OGD04597.1 MAG: hypothetical protein A3D85_00895 [Candidatus Amesbacteria bacterium RIFCSPHIGHO2_02_FULL_47_9]OGD06774.1 MAG: hypothetical protein A2899_05315 [Candidatus Amesbacteria bacterium RIFCSPLOWO2_01_FULL_49_25]